MTDYSKLTNREYWDQQRVSFKPYFVNKTEFSDVMEKLLPNNSNWTCVEVGAYPGKNLVYVAKHFGYKPIAIEYSQYVNHISEMMEYNGISNYEILNIDFFNLKDRVFDVVMSFGFIEHFDNYELVFKKHVNHIKPGGYLVMSVPFLGGLQGLLRRITYTDKQLAKIWSSHNHNVMQLSKLKALASVAGLDICYLNYTMKGNIWIKPKSDSLRKEYVWLVRLFILLSKTIFALLPSNRFWSPMLLLIARRK